MSKSMRTPKGRMRQRSASFEEPDRVGNATLACTLLAISLKPFYNWKHGFEAARGDRIALLDRSRCPHRS